MAWEEEKEETGGLMKKRKKRVRKRIRHFFLMATLGFLEVFFSIFMIKLLENYYKINKIIIKIIKFIKIIMNYCNF